MTRNEFLEFLKTDPVFKVADKQLVATLYESPFDNAVLDEDTGTTTVTFNGEEFTFEQDDSDLVAIMTENPSMAVILLAKRIIIAAGFLASEGIIQANNNDITTDATIMFPAPADDGGDDGGLG